MESIQSRTYTNVALTAIVVLLAVLAFQPYVSLPKAEAQLQVQGFTSNPNQPSNLRNSTTNPEVENAAATRDVANALKEVAAALRDQATAQKDVAHGIARLSSIGTTDAK